MPKRSRKRPRDFNSLAAFIVRESTEGAIAEESTKNQAAVELGRLGGKKGGRARAMSMTPEERHEAAVKAAQARWKKD